MLVIVWGLGLFFLGFVVHVVVWRIQKPRKSGKALLILFVAVAAGGLAAWWIATAAGVVAHEWGPLGITANLHAILICLSLAAAYIASYPAVEANSPTPRIVGMIFEAGEEGLPRKRLYADLNRDVLLVTRLRDLVSSDLAVYDGSVYRPTTKGRRLATLFIRFRRLLDAPTGG